MTMFEKDKLQFDEEFSLDVPKDILYDFMDRAWEINVEEFENPSKLRIEQNNNKLVRYFDTGKGINYRKIIFNKSDSHRTKVTIYQELPDINRYIFGPDQKFEGESFLMGIKIFFYSLEYIYKNEFLDDGYDTEVSKSKKPFYMKEYSSSVGSDIDILPTYNFLKKRYQLYNQMKIGYSTLKDKKMTILLDEEGRYLKIRSKRKFGDTQTDLYFYNTNTNRYVDIRYLVPYWHLFSKFKRLEFRYVFRSLRTLIKAFDHVYKKHMK